MPETLKRGTPLQIVNNTGHSRRVHFGGPINGTAFLFDERGVAFTAEAIYGQQFKISGEWWRWTLAEAETKTA